MNVPQVVEDLSILIPKLFSFTQNLPRVWRRVVYSLAFLAFLVVLVWTFWSGLFGWHPTMDQKLWILGVVAGVVPALAAGNSHDPVITAEEDATMEVLAAERNATRSEEPLPPQAALGAAVKGAEPDLLPAMPPASAPQPATQPATQPAPPVGGGSTSFSTPQTPPAPNA